MSRSHLSYVVCVLTASTSALQDGPSRTEDGLKLDAPFLCGGGVVRVLVGDDTATLTPNFWSNLALWLVHSYGNQTRTNTGKNIRAIYFWYAYAYYSDHLYPFIEDLQSCSSYRIRHYRWEEVRIKWTDRLTPTLWSSPFTLFSVPVGVPLLSKQFRKELTRRCELSGLR